MAVEFAGKCFQRSPAIFTGGNLSPKTATHAILSLIQNPSRNSFPLLNNSILKETSKTLIRSIFSCSSFDNFPYTNENNEQFLNRITKSNPKFKIPDENFHSIPPILPPTKSESWIHGNRFQSQNINQNPNSLNLPLSLRILKKKKQGKSESPSSSVKIAFSSTVFIVREIQSHLIRMRKTLISPKNFPIQKTLAKVHGDLHASFVWLFHEIFSSTPSLMLYLMLLLANFTVFSISSIPIFPPQSAQIEQIQNPDIGFNFPPIKTISICRSSAVGGGGNGNPKPPTIAGAGDDDGNFVQNHGMVSVADSLWMRIVEETAEMIRATGRSELLMDSETLSRFVSPVTAVAEPDDTSVYCATEFTYQAALAENKDDGLLLCNFAQFLFVVLRDIDRAEEYFKRAVRAEPVEAETLCRYANFLWVARKDLGAAEETFLEAISADPVNSHYSASYAHFLWTTGAQDTCYPLDDCDA